MKENKELIDRLNNHVTNLEGNIEQNNAQIEKLTVEKEKLIEDLNQKDLELEKIAAELVAQHSRFSLEKVEFENDVKVKFDQQMIALIQEKESEADEMENDFNEQLAEKVSEFNTKMQGMFRKMFSVKLLISKNWSLVVLILNYLVGRLEAA